MIHTGGHIIQSNNYYPFGMLHAGMDYRGVNPNMYNAGSEQQPGSGNYSTFYREYDPGIGRFMGIDIKAGMFASVSPYHYAVNSPVNFNDPLGDMPPAFLDDIRRRPLWFNEKFYKTSERGSGPGSGSHWSHQFSSSGFGMNAESFINSALNSQYGGSWSNGSGYLFTSDNQAFGAGAAYNFQQDSWRNTYYGSYEASVVGYIALSVTGELLSPGSVNKAIDIVKNKGVSDLRPAITCNEPNCTHAMLGPRRNRQQNNGDGLSTSFIAATIFNGSSTAAKNALNVINKELATQNLINNQLKKSLNHRTAFSAVDVPKGVRYVGKLGGGAFTAWGAYEVNEKYRSGEYSTGQMIVEQISNGIGAIPGYGTGWSIGWNLGSSYGPSTWYGSDDTK